MQYVYVQSMLAASTQYNLTHLENIPTNVGDAPNHYPFLRIAIAPVKKGVSYTWTVLAISWTYFQNSIFRQTGS